jgi:hypothetical protein
MRGVIGTLVVAVNVVVINVGDVDVVIRTVRRFRDLVGINDFARDEIRPTIVPGPVTLIRSVVGVLRRTGIGPVVVIARPVVVVVVVSARPFVVVTGTIVVVVPTGPVLIVDAAATTTGAIGRDGLRRGFDHAGTGGERRRTSRGRGSGQRSRSRRRIVGLVVRPLVLMIIVPTSATSATGAVVVLVRIVVVIGMVGPVLVRVVRAVVTTT